MCKPDSKFHFCTCGSLKQEIFPVPDSGIIDQAEYKKTQFIWRLYKYMGKKDGFMLGEMILPVEDLGDQLTSRELITRLNISNLFDFDYTSSKGDNLQICKEYIYKKIKGYQRPELYDFLSFIYKNGKWQEDYYDVFSDRIRRFNMGIIETEHTT